MSVRAGQKQQAASAQHHDHAQPHDVFQRLPYDLHHAVAWLLRLHVVRGQVVVLGPVGRIGVVDLQPGRFPVDRDLGEEVARSAVGVVLHREVIQLQLFRQVDLRPLFADGLVVGTVAEDRDAQRLLLGASHHAGKECQPQPGMVEDKAPAVAPRSEPSPQGDHSQMGQQGEEPDHEDPGGGEVVATQPGEQPRTFGSLRGRELWEEPDDQTAGYEPAQRPVGALRREPHLNEPRRAVFLVGIHHSCNPEQGYESIQREGEEGKREIAERALNHHRKQQQQDEQMFSLEFHMAVIYLIGANIKKYRLPGYSK